MAYEKVTPGQKIKGSPFARAAFANDTIDVVNAFNEGRLTGGRRPGNGSSSRVVVEVRNSTGGDRLRGEVVQLTGHLLDDVSEDHPWFDSDLVAEPVLRRMALLTRALKDGEIGPAQLAGVCLARIDVSDAGHMYARPTAGDAELASGDYGPLELLMEPDGTGVQDLWVLFNLFPKGRVCKLVDPNPGPLDKGDVGTFEIYNGALGSETGTGIEFQACAKFGAIPDNDVFCWADPNEFGYYATTRECTTEEEGA